MSELSHSVVFATDVLLPLTEVAREAADAGFNRAWTTEYPGRDAIARAQYLASSTEDITVGPGIAYAFTRPPLAMAALAADAYTVTGGRFMLGLGAGTRGLRSRFYGVDDFDRPAPRLAEYVELMRAAWRATDGLHFAGRFYQAEIPQYENPHDPEALAGLEVFGSGLNAVMLRHAARACDGIALHPLAGAEHYLRDVVAPAVRTGAAEAGATRRKLACWAIVSLDDDEKVARERARMALAFYFSTPSYRTIAENAPWEDAVTAIRDGFRDSGSDWSGLARLVPDEMVDDLTIAGTPDVARTQLSEVEKRYAENGATEIVFQTVGVGLTPEEVVGNCRRIVRELRPQR
ncbi:MAG: LLM class flavin-dependent oxidoreductase [Haloechinothrix sp.]